MSFSKTLSRTEMKNIKAGNDQIGGDDDCVRWSSCPYGCAEKRDGGYYCSTCCLAG